MAKILTERERLIKGYEGRINHKRKNLANTRKFHREVEAALERKIKLDEMTLRALKRSK